MRWLEYLVFLALVVGLARPVGLYLARVFERKPTFLDPALRPAESLLYRLLGIHRGQEMSAGVYTLCFLLFSAVSTGGLFLLLLAQHWLPGGPADRFLTTPMTADLAANTAISFSTTTTWQAYGGETTLRYLTQLVGLVSQNFLAGAAGLAVGIAFIRGFARDRSATVGNFWVDLVRGLLWVLLPLSLVGSVILIWQGVPANLAPYTDVHTLEGAIQTIAQGPVAALEFIRNLGTNGGGFFNANGAHPYENPTALSNFVEMLAIVMVPAALCYTFGSMTGQRRHGWLLYGVMTLLFALGLARVHWAQNAGNPALMRAAAPRTFATSNSAWTGNTEGKEVRFGTSGTTLAVVATSNGATGSTAATPDSLSPLGGGIAFFNMLLGEVTYGGLGTGLISMILAALLAVFVGGLMIGRAPAYLGNQIGITEMKLIVVYMLIGGLVILPLTAVALMSLAGRAGLTTNL